MPRALLITAVVTIWLTSAAAQSTAPLPDAERFFAEARKRLASNALLQSRFTFRERITQLRFNPLGRMGTGPIEVFEVYPVQGDDMTYRRLVERDGKPIPRSELAAQDRKFVAKYESWRRQLASEGQNQRQARERKHAEEQARDQKQAAEIIELFDFAIQRREIRDGHPSIVVTFKPRPNARPSSREGRVASSFAGTAWVHEHEYEVIRVEAQAVSDATFGWGVVARLYKGATALFTRAKVGDSWLPLESRFNGTGRALLFRRATYDFTRQYFDYRPFDEAQLTATLAAFSKSSN